jgi:hypothetical protein
LHRYFSKNKVTTFFPTSSPASGATAAGEPKWGPDGVSPNGAAVADEPKQGGMGWWF